MHPQRIFPREHTHKPMKNTEFACLGSRLRTHASARDDRRDRWFWTASFWKAREMKTGRHAAWIFRVFLWVSSWFKWVHGGFNPPNLMLRTKRTFTWGYDLDFDPWPYAASSHPAPVCRIFQPIPLG